MNDTLAHICIALVALAIALWLAGHILPRRNESDEEAHEEAPEDNRSFGSTGPHIIDQEREWRAPYGGRRL